MRSLPPPPPGPAPCLLRSRAPLRPARFVAVWLTCLSLAAIAAAARANDLEARIAAIRARPAFTGSSFGILVVELDSGEVVYSHRPRALLAPASTAKLVSAAGALGVLGADFRFETPVVRTGPLVDGVVSGDLVLVASGDPNLSQRPAPGSAASPTDRTAAARPFNRLRFVDRDHTYAGYTDADLVPGDPLLVLRRLARDVAAAGVREVRGDIIVDDGLFKETYDPFVGDFSAICVNDNVVDITVAPGSRIGDPVRVSYQPRVPSVDVRVLAKTSAPGSALDLWVDRHDGIASFVVRGTLPLGSRPVLRVGRLKDAALAAANIFADVLAEQGIAVRGQRRRGRFGPSLYSHFDVVARHVSPPLSESVLVTLKVSHNLHATMYPVLVGALKGKRGDRVAGFEAIRGFFRQGGLDVQSVLVHTGAGGGRSDRLSPRFLVDLLRFSTANGDFSVLWRSLPIAGIDGTLSERFAGSPLRGRVRAKTGTLVYQGSFNDSWIYLSKSLAGYVDLRKGRNSGEILCFAILIANTVTPSRAKGVDDLFDAQEDILEAIAASRVTDTADADSPEADSPEADEARRSSTRDR